MLATILSNLQTMTTEKIAELIEAFAIILVAAIGLPIVLKTYRLIRAVLDPDNHARNDEEWARWAHPGNSEIARENSESNDRAYAAWEAEQDTENERAMRHRTHRFGAEWHANNHDDRAE